MNPPGAAIPPLTHSERLLLAGQALHPGAPLYNMALAFTIEGPIDLDQFTRASARLSEICESFRITYRAGERIVLAQSSCPLEILDFSAHQDPEGSANAWLTERPTHCFELEQNLTDQVILQLDQDRYIWYLNQHHLITDGISASLVFDTMRRLYAGEDLEPLPSFDTHARARAQTPKANVKAEAYWDGILQSARPPEVQLFGRSLAVDTISSTRVVQKLGKERTAKLRKLALSPEIRGFTEDLSMFQILASLLFAFLHRQTGERHLSIATPTHNRSTPTAKRTPGVFIEVFPLEVELDSPVTFIDLLKAIRAGVLPYLTNAQPGQSRAELATRSQVLLNVVSGRFAEFAGHPVHTEWLHSGCGDRQHALRLAIYDFDDEGDLSFLFDFNDEAFSAQERDWTTTQFFRLADAVLETPEVPIPEIDLLDSAERTRVLAAWIGKKGAFPSKDVTALFEDHRWDHPDQPAVVGPSVYDGTIGTLTYEQLDIRANQFAHHLMDLGLGKGDHVALLLEPSIEWITSMLGIVKTGAAYLSLSLSDPIERLQSICKDGSVRQLISRSALLSQLPSDVPHVLLDVEEGAIASAPDVSTDVAIHPGDCFYLISTSGSTGTPKTVCGRHLSLMNLLADVEGRSPLEDSAAGTWWTSGTFDVSLYEIWSMLAYGRTLRIIPPESRLQKSFLFDLLAAEGIQSSYLPAFMLEDLVTALDSEALSLPRLRRLLVGVEPIQQSILVRLRQLLPNLQIINGYGPAEATVCCTLYDVPDELPDTQITPIGRPVQNLTAYVLDPHGQPTSFGAPGELYVGGIGLTEGYWNQPDENSKRFRPNPFADSPHQLYRTGDRVRSLVNGDLQFVGRVDEQLKIRGQRIEPGEIIVALESHPSVRQASIKAWPVDNPSQLVAYLSTRSPVTDDELRKHLETRLPRNFMPASFVRLDTLPLNANGKVDVHALTAPERKASDLKAQTETEQILARIWSEVLSTDHVTPDENFFELGGDSILSLRIVAQAARHGIHLAPNLIFAHQTIAKLAEASTINSAEAAPVATEAGPLPLGPIQRWFYDQAFAEPGVFNHEVVLTLADSNKVEKIQDQLNEILSRHEAFRLMFIDGEQRLAEQVPSLTITAFADLDSARRELHRPFALAEAPLLRAAFVAPNRLILVAHHLIIDGVSWAVLIDEINEGTAPKPTIGFGQWVSRFNAEANKGTYDDEISFWTAQQGTHPTTLPIDHPQGENSEGDRQQVSIQLSADETARLLEQTRVHFQAPLRDLLIAAIANAVCPWSKSSQLCLDLEGHGRESALLDDDLSRSIGWFTSLFPVVIDWNPAHRVLQQVTNVTKCLNALPRSGAAYGALRQRCETLRSPAQILFNYLGHMDNDARGLVTLAKPIKLVRDPNNARCHLLEIDAVISGNVLTLNWHFSGQVHDTSTIEALAKTCLDTLRQWSHPKGDTGIEGRFALAGLDKKGLGRLTAMLNKADKS